MSTVKSRDVEEKKWRCGENKEMMVDVEPLPYLQDRN